MRTTAAGPTVPPWSIIEPLQPRRQAGARRVGVRDRDAFEPVVADDVHDAPVRQRGHGEP